MVQARLIRRWQYSTLHHQHLARHAAGLDAMHAAGLQTMTLMVHEIAMRLLQKWTIRRQIERLRSVWHAMYTFHANEHVKGLEEDLQGLRAELAGHQRELRHTSAAIECYNEFIDAGVNSSTKHRVQSLKHIVQARSEQLMRETLHSWKMNWQLECGMEMRCKVCAHWV